MSINESRTGRRIKVVVAVDDNVMNKAVFPHHIRTIKVSFIVVI